MEDSKIGSTSNFEGLLTLTLTLDRLIWHTIVYHSSTSTYTPNFIQIEQPRRNFLWTDGCTYVRMADRLY